MLTLTAVLATRSTSDLTPSAVRELGPFCHRDRHATEPGATRDDDLAPVFYADIDRGVRVELTLPGAVPGLTPDALLMACPDGTWEVFEAAGLLAAYDSGAVRVSVSR